MIALLSIRSKWRDSTHRCITSMLIICCCHFLSPFASAQKFYFRPYSTSNGLAQQFLNDVTQDDRGFIWIATEENGVNRFDGREFLSFDKRSGLRSNTVRTMAADGKGHLFLGTDRGITCIRLRKDAQDSVDSILTHALRAITSPIRALRMIDADQLAIETEDSAFVFTIARMNLRNGVRQPSSLAALQRDFPQHEIRDVAEDGKHRLWIATNHGLLLRDGKTTRLFDSHHGLPVTDIRAIHCDAEQNLWLATSDGLFLHVPDRFTSYDRKVLPEGSGGGWEIKEAPDGSMWIGTLSGGAVHLRDGVVHRTLTKTDGLPSNSVSEILFEQSGSMIFATMGGMAMHKDGRWITRTIRDGLPSNAIEYLIPSKHGGYWLSTHNGLVRYRGGKFTTYTTSEGLPSNRISQIAEDIEGTLWIGTHAGACTMRDGDPQTLKRIARLDGVRVVSVFIDQNRRAWFGTLGDGAYCINVNNFAHLTREDGLGGNTVYFTAQDRTGTMYFGTNAGVSALDASKLKLTSPSRKEEQRSVAREEELRHPNALRAYTFTSADGLAGDEMNAGAVSLDSKGNLWFGSIGGVTKFEPPDKNEDRVMFNLSLTELRIGSQSIAIQETIILQPEENVFTIRCTLPSFRNPGAVRYYFRLKGIETSWRESTDGRISYTAIAPGDYELVALATIGEGIWTKSETVLTISKKPHFYQTMWFWILATIIPIAIGVVIYRYRLMKKLEMERMRLRIASDLHDDIGATLSSVAALQEMELRSSHEGKSRERLERSLRLIRSVSTSMSDIVWAVNPKNDSVKSFGERLEDYIDTITKTGSVTIHFHRDEHLDTLPINAVNRRNLLLICKEAVNNALKHAGSTKIEIVLLREAQQIIIKIVDDGRGFDATHRSNGNGLEGMKRRANAMNAHFALSSDASGTAIEIKLAVKSML